MYKKEVNNMKRSIIAIAVSMLCVQAFATNDGGEGPHGNVHHNGGQGGSASSMAGSRSNSSAVSNNRNTNNVSSSNRQGQRQSQNQSARQAQSSNSSSQGGRASATGGSSSATSNDSNNAAQTVRVDSPKLPASSAYAASVAPTAVCAGGTSGGAQGASFGLSFGTSWTDENCMLLEQVRTVAIVLGDRDSAEEMMCGLEKYREARARIGNPCLIDVQDKEKRVTNSTYDEKDPYIRQRLGLPKL